MKWKIYAKRVIALFESDEPGKEMSVDTIARGLDIPRPEAQNALFRLWKDKQLEREKKGRGYRYWLPVGNESVLDRTDENFEKKFGGESQD
jgi:predicted transcriptional regulator